MSKESIAQEIKAVYFRIEEEIKKLKILRLEGFVEYLKRERDVEIDADSVSKFVGNVTEYADYGMWELLKDTPFDDIEEFFSYAKNRYPALEGENLVSEYFNEK
jgi:hypothetical protein